MTLFKFIVYDARGDMLTLDQATATSGFAARREVALRWKVDPDNVRPAGHRRPGT